MTANNVALTIQVRDVAPTSLPASLEQRLAGSPTKSPADLAAEIRAHAERTEKLRKAHLDAVRDRAARDTQRAKEAAARKLRLAASRVEKLRFKLESVSAHVDAKKEASEEERKARKARREAMAQAVAESRRAASEAKFMAGLAHKEAEALASAKHIKAVREVQDKSAATVKHAMSVVAAQKEKEAAICAERTVKLEQRLSKAAFNRDSPRVSSPDKETVRHRVLNAAKFDAEVRRLKYEKSMAAAADKREQFLQGVKEKAIAENNKAASVAASFAANNKAEAKAALYDRLLRAEVARLSALKNKYMSSKPKGDTISVIVVRMDVKPRMPPPALSMRLSVVPRNLLLTAAARQAGAASRRAALRRSTQFKQEEANHKRAAVFARIGKMQAAKEAAVKAKATRALITLALQQGRRVHAAAQENRRALWAQSRRAAAVKANKMAGAAAAAKCAAADERRAAKTRATAKTGVVAIRLAAFKSRRDARSSAVLARGETSAARCAAATAKRAALLAARVALAQKRMKAMHPKRDVPDMEIKIERSAA